MRCNPKWQWWNPRWMKTSSHQLQKVGKWQTFGRWWWWEGRAYRQWFFAFVFFCFLQIMVDGFVMVISSFDGNRCLELFNYLFFVCVSNFCVVVWRMWMMEHIGPIYMKGLHELWTNIELNFFLWLLFLVYVVLLASNYNKNGSLKFQNGVGQGDKCPTTKNQPSFF